jgi:signal peptidase
MPVIIWHLGHAEFVVQPPGVSFFRGRIKMKAVFRWINTAVTVILVLVLASSVFLIFQSRVNPTHKVPSIMGYKPLTVLSGSMSPLLQPGDVIVARETKPEDVKVGDVITYRVDKKTLVTHRVVEILNKGGEIAFKTRGDANNVDDPEPVSPERLVGRLAFKFPRAGYLGRFVRTFKGFVLLVMLPTVLLIAGEMRNILAELSRESK